VQAAEARAGVAAVRAAEVEVRAAEVGRRRAVEAAGTARWAPHPEAVAVRGVVRWALRADQGAESVASRGRAAGAAGAAGAPCRANQAARGAAAASSPAQFCLIGVTWRVNVGFGQTSSAVRGIQSGMAATICSGVKGMVRTRTPMAS
jgi:hypothetical protein